MRLYSVYTSLETALEYYSERSRNVFCRNSNLIYNCTRDASTALRMTFYFLTYSVTAPTSSTILPMCVLLSINSWAAAASANGKVL